VAQLRRLGVTVIEQVPTGVHLSTANARYLAAKARHGEHTLDLALGGRAAEWLNDGAGTDQAARLV
jgi:hypothetical protein